MKPFSSTQQYQCIEYIKQEMRLMGIDQHAESPPEKKKQFLGTNSYTYMTVPRILMKIMLTNIDHQNLHHIKSRSTYT